MKSAEDIFRNQIEFLSSFLVSPATPIVFYEKKMLTILRKVDIIFKFEQKQQNSPFPLIWRFSGFWREIFRKIYRLETN